MAKNAGIVACVTDGLVRDIEGINQVGMPTFAQGLSPNSPFKDGPGEIGGIDFARRRHDRAPATCWSAISTGWSWCRAPMSRAVGAELAAIADKEARMEQVVKAGATYPAWLDDILKSDRVRYLD